MARYQPGNLVAFIHKFERCGVIAQIDERRGGKVGYRLNTGYDIITAYEDQIVLISTDAPIIPPKAAMKKIDAIEEGEPYYTPNFREALWDFISSKSPTATAFINWIAGVKARAIDAFFKSLANELDPNKIIAEIIATLITKYLCPILANMA